jgi:hypothetical protein
MTRRGLFALVAGILSGKVAATASVDDVFEASPLIEYLRAHQREAAKLANVRSLSELSFLMSDIKPFWEYYSCTVRYLDARTERILRPRIHP